MRLWSIHPKYLDTSGLTACWREALLAKKVLMGQTMGYKFHPQLIRLRECSEPLTAVNTYLAYILSEAIDRGYKFDTTKIEHTLVNRSYKLLVKRGQLDYEFEHLMKKMSGRNPLLYKKFSALENIEPHPMFVVIEVITGGVEEWEKIK